MAVDSSGKGNRSRHLVGVVGTKLRAGDFLGDAKEKRWSARMGLRVDKRKKGDAQGFFAAGVAALDSCGGVVGAVCGGRWRRKWWIEEGAAEGRGRGGAVDGVAEGRGCGRTADRSRAAEDSIWIWRFGNGQSYT